MLHYQRLSKTGILLLSCRQSRSLSGLHNIKYIVEENVVPIANFKRHQSAVSQSRCYSNDIEQLDLEFLNFHEEYSYVDYMKNILYPCTDDVIINKLKSCKTSTEVFNVIDNIESCSPQQLIQAVLNLRHFFVFCMSTSQYNTSNPLILTQKNDEIITSPSFVNLVNKIVNASSQMNLEEVSYCILILHRLRVFGRPMIQLITAFENVIKNTEPSQIPLSCLERVFIPLKEYYNIWSLYTFSEFLPVLLDKLDSCNDFADFGKLTVCFSRMPILLNSGILDKYTEKCSFLFNKAEDNLLELERLKTVYKVTLFLTSRSFGDSYEILLKQITSILQGNLKSFNVSEIAILRKTMMLHLMEPYQILNEMDEIISEWKKNFLALQDFRSLFYINLMFPKMKLMKINELQNQLRNYFDQPLSFSEFYFSLNHVYHILLTYNIGYDEELIDIYWTRVMKLFLQYPPIDLDHILMQICYKYMQYSLDKRYCNRKFEELALSILQPLFRDNEKKIFNPSKFLKFALLMVFFEKSFASLTDVVWERILSSISLLDIYQNAKISNMLKLVQNHSMRSRKNSKYLHHYIRFISALNKNTLEYLTKNENIKFDRINSIFLAYNCREGLKTSSIFKLICDRYAEIPLDQMNSRLIFNCIRHLTYIGHLEPVIANNVAEYCIREKNIITGSVGSSVINYMFMFGYTPNNLELFIDSIIQIINRDTNNFSGCFLIKTALALSYYCELPVQLVDTIFDLKFMGKIDAEFQHLASKIRINKVRKNLMELNRVMCIQYPNREIPWFHEKYCMEQQILETNIKTYLHEDVLRTLKRLVHVDKSIDINCYSPYNHKIDILLHSNRKGEPIVPDICKPVDHRKTAILLNTMKACSPYYREKGRYDLMINQLEILGYKVVVIDNYIWNAMYMSEPHAKENYLCSQIWSHGKIDTVSKCLY